MEIFREIRQANMAIAQGIGQNWRDHMAMTDMHAVKVTKGDRCRAGNLGWVKNYSHA